MSRDLFDFVRELNTLNDDNLADRVIENSDVQWCLSELQDILEEMPTLTPPNEPLTVKQLQKMVGEPVYDYLGQEWYVIQEYYGHELTMTDGTRFFDDDEIDGVDKRFYRRPPEGEEDT